MSSSEYYYLDFRAKSIGGGVKPGVLKGPGGVAALSEHDHITFLLHGYNVDRTDGTAGLARLADLQPWAQDAGAIVAVLWPGDSKLGALAFPFEVNDADDTVREFLRFLKEELQLRLDQSVSFVSHSLGARVVMGLSGELTRRGYRVDQTCLMAAAIDRDSLSSPHEYRQTVKANTRVSVLASKRDNVLKWAYPVGDLLETLFHWRDEAHSALGLRGPTHYEDFPVPANVHTHRINKDRKADHGHYIPGKNVRRHMEKHNQLSAAQFTNDALSGESNPKYPPAPPKPAARKKKKAAVKRKVKGRR